MMSFAHNTALPVPWDHRPTISSPLSSSPLRASSPLSPLDNNVWSHRQTQSSPIKPPKFKYATRQPRPNPVVRRREEAQEKRRQDFLQNVRQKAEDKAWRRRDIEGQFLKQTLVTGMGQLMYDAPDFSEADIEDAMAYQCEKSREPQDEEDTSEVLPMEDEDLEAMVASYEDREQATEKEATHNAPSTISDDDYDDLFAELVANESHPQTHWLKSNPSGSSSHEPFGIDEDSAMSM